MTSTEVNDAIKAPEREKDKTSDVSSVLDQLKQKRAELATASATLSAAEAAMDLEGVIAAKQRVDVLRLFISRLEVQEAGVLEQEGQRRAKALVTQQASELATVAQRVAAAQKKVRSALDAAVAAIEAEVSLRREAVQIDLANEVLSARFGFPRSETRVKIPAIQDYATPLLRVIARLRPWHGSRRLVVSLIASMTDEQRRAAHVSAAAQFFATSGKELPEKVQRIMSETPIPAEVTPSSVAKQKADDDDAVIGTGRSDPVLAQAATEAVALCKLGMPDGHVHRR
jgi:hypothetical protein